MGSLLWRGGEEVKLVKGGECCLAKGLANGQFVQVGAGKAVYSFDFSGGPRGMKAGCRCVVWKTGEWKAVLFKRARGDGRDLGPMLNVGFVEAEGVNVALIG